MTREILPIIFKIVDYRQSGPIELIHCIYLQDFAKSADLKLFGILKAFQTFEVLHCKKKNFIFISATI